MGEPRVVTFGCRLNAFESEVIRERMAAAGITDAVVVNTCTVTAEAERQARQAIRKLKRDNPDMRILVTGCAAQMDAEKFSAMPEVDGVLGNAEKMDAAHLATATGAVRVSDPWEADHPFETPRLEGFGERTRAFLQIQQGCDHSCTFCIVPHARGPNRGARPDDLIERAQSLVAAGHAEIVLTGVDICSYNVDGGLAALVARLLAEVPEMRRLRLSTLDPGALDDALIEQFATQERLMPHAHLSLQAADDMVLKRMKRRHSRGRAIELAERLRAARPGITLGADLIAGFPTETDAMAENTFEAVRHMGLIFLHVFPYSPRPGTPAARMPQVPVAIRRERAARLRELGEDALMRQLSTRLGGTVEVLVETDGSGRTPHYEPVRLGFAAEPGAIVRVRVNGLLDGCLLAGAPA